MNTQVKSRPVAGSFSFVQLKQLDVFVYSKYFMSFGWFRAVHDTVISAW